MACYFEVYTLAICLYLLTSHILYIFTTSNVVQLCGFRGSYYGNQVSGSPCWTCCLRHDLKSRTSDWVPKVYIYFHIHSCCVVFPSNFYLCSFLSDMFFWNNSVMELVDSAIPLKYLDPVKQTILQVEGVKVCSRVKPMMLKI